MIQFLEEFNMVDRINFLWAQGKVNEAKIVKLKGCWIPHILFGNIRNFAKIDKITIFSNMGDLKPFRLGGAKLIIWFAWRGRVSNLPTGWNDFAVFCRVKAIFPLFKYFSLKHENSSTVKVPPSGNRVISYWNQYRCYTLFLIRIIFIRIASLRLAKY